MKTKNPPAKKQRKREAVYVLFPFDKPDDDSAIYADPLEFTVYYSIISLTKENNETKVKAVVNMDYGLGAITGISKFVEEARKYEKGVYIRRNESDERCDLKSVASTACASCHKGAILEIIVEGTDKKADTVALRLYSGITSCRTYAPHFNRQFFSLDKKAKKEEFDKINDKFIKQNQQYLLRGCSPVCL